MRDQVILADHAVAVANEVVQKVEYLRFYGKAVGSAPQFLPVDVKRVIFKIVDQPVASAAALYQPEEKIGES